MTPELTETIELIVAGLSLLITVVMIVCLWVLTKRNLKLIDQIKFKNERLKSNSNLLKIFAKELASRWDYESKLREQIRQFREEVDEYRFVMAISDDISAEMQKEIEALTLERDTLKAKLNHKKRPQNANT